MAVPPGSIWFSKFGFRNLASRRSGQRHFPREAWTGRGSIRQSPGLAHAGALAIEGRVAEVGAATLGQLEHPPHDFRVLRGDVVRLPDVVAHVVELGLGEGLLQVLARPAVHAGLVPAERAIRVGQDELPIAGADRFELRAAPHAERDAVEEIDLVRVPRVLLAGEEGPDVEAVDRVVG